LQENGKDDKGREMNREIGSDDKDNEYTNPYDLREEEILELRDQIEHNVNRDRVPEARFPDRLDDRELRILNDLEPLPQSKTQSRTGRRRRAKMIDPRKRGWII
jgi:hypothetical protein